MMITNKGKIPQHDGDSHAFQKTISYEINSPFLFTDRVQPTEISQELQYKKYENHFPVPVLENVYEGWDPVDHGHPLKDETLYYAPPSLERVVFSQQGPQSR